MKFDKEKTVIFEDENGRKIHSLSTGERLTPSKKKALMEEFAPNAKGICVMSSWNNADEKRAVSFRSGHAYSFYAVRYNAIKFTHSTTSTNL